MPVECGQRGDKYRTDFQVFSVSYHRYLVFLVNIKNTEVDIGIGI